MLTLQNLSSDDDISLIKQHEKDSHKHKIYKKLNWIAMSEKQTILKKFNKEYSVATVSVI